MDFLVDRSQGGHVKAKGTIYLSNIRMVFVASKAVGDLVAFDMPLVWNFNALYTLISVLFLFCLWWDCTLFKIRAVLWLLMTFLSTKFHFMNLMIFCNSYSNASGEYSALIAFCCVELWRILIIEFTASGSFMCMVRNSTSRYSSAITYLVLWSL